jgi:hypothetical protein
MNSYRCVGLLAAESRHHLLRKSCVQIIASTIWICQGRSCTPKVYILLDEVQLVELGLAIREEKKNEEN